MVDAATIPNFCINILYMDLKRYIITTSYHQQVAHYYSKHDNNLTKTCTLSIKGLSGAHCMQACVEGGMYETVTYLTGRGLPQ